MAASFVFVCRPAECFRATVALDEYNRTGALTSLPPRLAAAATLRRMRPKHDKGKKKDVCTAFNPSISSATLFDLGVFLGHLVTHVFLANLFKRVQLETCDRLQKFARCSFVSVGGSCLGPSSPFIFLSSVSFVIILYFYSTLSFILLLFRKTTSARHANVFRLGCNSFSYISIVFP